MHSLLVQLLSTADVLLDACGKRSEKCGPMIVGIAGIGTVSRFLGSGSPAPRLVLNGPVLSHEGLLSTFKLIVVAEPAPSESHQILERKPSTLEYPLRSIWPSSSSLM